jgi:hypothetical protein
MGQQGLPRLEIQEEHKHSTRVETTLRSARTNDHQPTIIYRPLNTRKTIKEGNDAKTSSPPTRFRERTKDFHPGPEDKVTWTLGDVPRRSATPEASSSLATTSQGFLLNTMTTT